MKLEVQLGRWAWPNIEREVAVGIVAGRPALLLYRAGVALPEVLPMTVEQADQFGDAFDAASDIASGVVRGADVDSGRLLG